MNPAIHHLSVAQQQAQLARESCRGRYHRAADLPARERRLSTYGARLLGLVRRPQPAAALRPAREH